ncbi:hypothetical protein [Schleiferilactobacillus perolens]|jgi:hypothetical protein|uniref:hypothetical protein n=1 Tax=Schleiferilactobacillus perolens TaxID=100468 RepID=UPI002357E649|nr:hypothetical protein [Schleiferilactobacillus perolens]MCI2171534.1 hypothetical protein [Schleiferilactobacillus perolens]
MQWRKRKQYILGLLSAVLAAGGLLLSTQPVAADTVGTTLENGTGNSVPKDTNGQPWNMYQIPGLNREHNADEGSFVQWGYAGWKGYDASQSMPLADMLPGGLQQVHWGILGQNGPETAITRDWRYAKDAKTAETGSPVSITFRPTQINTDKYGKQYFSLSYVDKNDLIDFSSEDNAKNFMAGTEAPKFNTEGVKSKMKYDPTSQKFSVADNQSLNGGYLQATGNVPLQAAVAKSNSTVDATMAGDWAVMVRVQVANGIDAKAMASAIDWSKSYYYLSVDSVPITFLGLINTGIKVNNINFPLQFDHHVYLDPYNKQNFFLKVKGVPFNILQSYNNAGKITAKMALQKGKSDYADYLNNRQISTDAATTLDNLYLNGSNTAAQQTTLNNNDLLLGSGSTLQPNFPTVVGDAKGSWLSGDPSIWDPFGGLLRDWLNNFSWLVGTKSPVYDLGDIGRMISLLNAGQPTSDRPLAPTGIFQWGNILINGLTTGVAQYFVDHGFQGSAHINFSFDMSKYNAGKTKEQQALTRGRFFSSPNADGTFNASNGLGTNDAIKITMYDSSDLVDPYSVTKGLGREEISGTYKQLRTQLQAGTTPADYAVLNATSETQLNAVGYGTTYPTYTNFVGWTGAVVPFDRDYWDTSTNPISKTDSTHITNPLGDDIQYRTAAPSEFTDGVFANNGQVFKILKNAEYAQDENKYRPLYNNTNTDGQTVVTQSGTIRPERYANVYQYYQYDANGKGTLPADNQPLQIYSDASHNLGVQVKPLEKFDKMYQDQWPLNLGPFNSDGTSQSTSYSGTLDHMLNVSKWRYAGTLNGAPLADTTMQLDESTGPSFSRPSVTTIPKSKILGNNHWWGYIGGYNDNMAINSDQVSLKLTNVADSSSTQTATDKKLVGGPYPTYWVYGDVSQSNTTGVKDPEKYKTNMQANFQLPKTAAEEAANFSIYNVDWAIQRNGGNPLPMSTAASGGLTNNLPNEIGTQTNSVLIVLDHEDQMPFTIEKTFADGTVKHSIQPDEKSVGVNATVTNKATGGDITNPTTMVLHLPLAKKSDATGDGGTVTAPTSDQFASVTKLDNDAEFGAGYVAYQVTLKQPLTPGSSFKYSYTYQYPNSANLDNIPYDQELQDMITNQNSATGDMLRGLSNGIEFTGFNTGGTVRLTHVPANLDFGTNNPLPTTAKNTYGLTDDSKKDAYLQVTDGHTKPVSWFIQVSMSPFRTTDESNGQDDFQVNFGTANNLINGQYVVADTKPNPADYVTTTYPNGTDNPDYQQALTVFNDHQSTPMTSNNDRSMLYWLERTYEPDEKTTWARYYPNTTLTVPVSDAGSLQAGKQYTSNVTYLLNSSGDEK